MNLLITTQKVDKNDQLLGFFIEWLREFAQKFEKITVLCLEKGEFELPENVKVLSLGKDRGSGKLRQLSAFYFLIYTHRNDYDAVFVHMNPIWMVLGGICWKMLGKKKFLWYTSGGVTLKLKIAEKLADKVLTASPESFRFKSKKVVVTGHGIDTGLFQPDFSRSNLKDGVPRFDLGEIKILSVGRIAPVKNYETLIEAAKILKDEGVNFAITMIGEAPLEKDKEYEKKIKLLITDYQLQNFFNFVGKVSHKELLKYYQLHDLFVHLSKTGSLDKTLLEAMACGMSVLSSSDAARYFLPPELIFNESDFTGLAEKIKLVNTKFYGQELRKYILENHNLGNLINKISEIVKL